MLEDKSVIKQDNLFCSSFFEQNKRIPAPRLESQESGQSTEVRNWYQRLSTESASLDADSR